MRCLFLLIALMWPTVGALAANDYGPKQLLVDPIPTAKVDDKATKKHDRFYVPPEMAKTREDLRGEFNAWLDSDKAVKKFCDDARTLVERADCKRKQQISQQRIDNIHLRMRQNQFKIDNWRREERGLPPLPPTDAPRAAAPQSSAPTTPPVKKESPVLLPQTNAPLPAGTF